MPAVSGWLEDKPAAKERRKNAAQGVNDAVTRALLLVLVLVTNGTLEARAQQQLQNPANPAQQQSVDDVRGTAKSPLVIDVLPTKQTPEVAADAEQERNDQRWARRWGVYTAVTTTLLLFFQLIYFGIQTKRLTQTIHKMDEISKGQTADMKASIAEATKSAKAMEQIAKSMATSADSVQASLVITREIADSNMRAVELNRPYLDLIPRDIIDVRTGAEKILHGLQAEFDIHNYGHTAARLDLVEHATRYWTAKHDITYAEKPGVMIPPGANYRLRCYAGELEGELMGAHASQKLIVIKVRGEMRYLDQFGTTHTKHFGWLCQYRQTKPPYFSMDGPNHEEGWGGRRGQLQGQRDADPT